MALRTLAASLNLRTLSAVCGSSARGLASIPTVFDSLVEFTVVDAAGVRHTCRGLEGQTVAEALLEHSGLGMEFMTPTPSGINSVDCHLLVANDMLGCLPPKTETEASDLADITNDLQDNSRLGSSITLSKDTSGIVVAIGSILPFDTP